MKRIPQFLKTGTLYLVTGCLGLWYGCSSNAQLRTQKVLKPGEVVFTGSGSAAAGGTRSFNSPLFQSDKDEVEYTGIAGIRAGGVVQAGFKGGEAGLYLGYGLPRDFILGLDLKRYVTLGLSRPWKLGVQGEINHNLGSSSSQSSGTVLAFRPYLLGSTSKQYAAYGGIHGLVANGRLKDRIRWENEVYVVDNRGYGCYEWRYYDEEVDYSFTSYGIGLTWGNEYFSGNNTSVQFQLDATLVKNLYVVDKGKFPDYPHSDRELSPITFMVSASMGLNFFKPSRSAPDDRRDIREGKAGTYDPNTGLPLAISSPSMAYNPATGKPVGDKDRGMVWPQYDPVTGRPVWEKPQPPKVPEYKPTTEVPPAPQVAWDTRPSRATGRAPDTNTVRSMARENARRNHQGGQWGFCGGVGTCGLTGLAGFLGATIAGVPVFIIGAGGTAIVTPALASETNVKTPQIPQKIENDPDQAGLYIDTYKRETKRLRRNSVYTGEAVLGGLTCVGAVLVGLYFMAM